MAEFGNVIAAFSEEQVERLTGLTKHRLRYWDRTEFFKPEFGEDNRRAAYSRVYSFKDLTSLRVIAALINQFNVSVQHLRQVSEKLKHLNEDKWIKTTLYVLNNKVNFWIEGESKPREIVSGQYALLPLQRVIADTKRDIAELHARPLHTKGQIERNRLVAHNEWVVKGTRIPIRAIREFRAAGYTDAQIIHEYPDLTPEDIKAALAHKERTAAA